MSKREPTVEFRSAHRAVAFLGRYAFTNGVLVVPEAVAPEVRAIARRRPYYGIVEVRPAALPEPVSDAQPAWWDAGDAVPDQPAPDAADVVEPELGGQG